MCVSVQGTFCWASFEGNLKATTFLRDFPEYKTHPFLRLRGCLFVAGSTDSSRLGLEPGDGIAAEDLRQLGTSRGRLVPRVSKWAGQSLVLHGYGPVLFLRVPVLDGFKGTRKRKYLVVILFNEQRQGCSESVNQSTRVPSSCGEAGHALNALLHGFVCSLACLPRMVVEFWRPCTRRLFQGALLKRGQN